MRRSKRLRKSTASAVNVDAAYIDAVSFVPTEKGIHALVEHGRSVDHERACGRVSLRLSKYPTNADLCPISRRPGDTILHRLASVSADRLTNFSLLPDKGLPFWVSNGPNIVFVGGPDYFINIFSGDELLVLQVLRTLIEARRQMLSEILDSIPRKINACRLDPGNIATAFPYNVTSGETDTIPGRWIDAYDKVSVLFEEAAKAFKRVALWSTDYHKILEAIGLSVVSFFQTWVRGDEKPPGDAEFSVMTPHFQTKIYVSDEKKLMKATGLSKEHVDAYTELMVGMSQRMEDLGYCGEKGPAFVNADLLLAEMESRA